MAEIMTVLVTVAMWIVGAMGVIGIPVLGIGLIASGLVKRAQPMPFGPYLAGAGLIALHAPQLLDSLLSPGRAL